MDSDDSVLRVAFWKKRCMISRSNSMVDGSASGVGDRLRAAAAADAEVDVISAAVIVGVGDRAAENASETARTAFPTACPTVDTAAARAVSELTASRVVTCFSRWSLPKKPDVEEKLAAAVVADDVVVVSYCSLPATAAAMLVRKGGIPQ